MERVVRLTDLPLQPVQAHGGTGEILCHRPFTAADFVGPCHFIDYAVLPPGTSIGVHTHGEDEEVYLVMEGEGTMHLDGEEIAVGPGALIVNRPGGTHGLRNDGNTPLRLFVIEVGTGREGTS